MTWFLWKNADTSFEASPLFLNPTYLDIANCGVPNLGSLAYAAGYMVDASSRSRLFLLSTVQGDDSRLHGQLLHVV